MNKTQLESRMREKEKAMRLLLPFNSEEERYLWHEMKFEVEEIAKAIRRIEKGEVKRRVFLEKEVEL